MSLQSELLAAAKRKETLLRWLAEVDWVANGFRDRDHWLLAHFNCANATDALLKCQELFEKEGLL